MGRTVIRHYVHPRDIKAGKNEYTTACGRTVRVERATALRMSVTCKTCYRSVKGGMAGLV